jgi:peptidoglycan/xylan/chitin deacetylase (PgdA/CDA1 family)
VQTLAPSSAGPLTVALTFDDGPGDDTAAVLDILAREHVHATFFVVGRQVAANPGLVRRASEEGHLIGNHTYDHVYPRDLHGGWTAHYLSGQLRSTADLVRAETGLPTCFFRPPGGFLPSTALPAARRMRMTTSLWSVDTRDWDVQGAHAPSASAKAGQARTIAARAIAGGRPGSHPIVLFHDGGGYRGSTAAAVTRVIDWYKAHGYTFVRLDGQV